MNDKSKNNLNSKKIETKLIKKVKDAPNNLMANKLLGIHYAKTEQYEKSLQFLSKTLLLEPDCDNYYNMAVALQNLTRYEEAIVLYLEAAKLDPNKSEIHSNLGAIYKNQHNYNEALVSYMKCIELNPTRYYEYINYAIVLLHLKKYEEALKITEFVLSKNPEYINALLFKVTLLEILGDEVMFLENIAKIKMLDKNNHDADWALARYHLLLGDYAKGWKAFESRWLAGTGLIETKFDKPKWLDNFSIDGATLLIHAEQGVGDTLQFCRYVSCVIEKYKGAKIIFSVPESLKELMCNCFNGVMIISETEDLPKFDAHIPLMSLPLVFGTLINTIPNKLPYIFATQEKATYWKKIVGMHSSPEQTKIGLVWNGGFRPNQPNLFAINERRNLPIQFLKYFENINASFYSLQKGNPAELEFAELMRNNWNGYKIHDFVYALHNFSDTAGLIENLDLIISVDTSTAHLAAAMGKPVWLLNRYDTCWRWLKDREDSPWYPSVKIFNQPKADDWTPVMMRICEELNKYIK